ncbi:MAG: response regulator transcription factor [Anaerolineales bacterium]|nr:response regulator transcription factor [Anaerolineales bacterium]
MNQLIRVLVVDDHSLIRRGLRTLFTAESGMELVGEASDGEEAIQKARALKPDVILLDLMMPRKSGIEAIKEIKRENSASRILVLTSFSEDDKVFAALRAGAAGYVLKDIRASELLKAVRDVYRGESSLHPSIARKFVEKLATEPAQPPQPQRLTSLTDREIEGAETHRRGLTNLQIAERLSLSERTVAAHLRSILAKLQLPNRTQATLYALRTGLVDLGSESQKTGI